MTKVSELIKIKNVEEKIDEITEFVKKEVFEIFEKKGIVIGLSGGIDSAITAALCAKSIGSEKILGLILPEKESDENSKNFALEIAEKYNIDTETIDITNI